MQSFGIHSYLFIVLCKTAKCKRFGIDPVFMAYLQIGYCHIDIAPTPRKKPPQKTNSMKENG